MKHFSIVLTVAILATISSARSEVREKEKPSLQRPNILWIIAEDLGTELACYGTQEVLTPNLDRLASEGVRYLRCYSNGPVCSVSRSSFMTGMHATTIGAQDHRTVNKQPLPNGICTLSDWMRDLGYFTLNIKTFPISMGFKGLGKTDWNFTYQGQCFDSASWDDLKSHQPFYAQINFQEPHRPFHAPSKADPDKVQFPPYYPDHPVTRRDWASYLDSISELDRKIGLVRQQLEKDGLSNHTIIIFFGDNGQAHVRGKQFCYESGLHVPMIIYWPKGIPVPVQFSPGTVDSRLLGLIDLAPTMIDIAGGTKPSRMEGHIFLGKNREPNQKYIFGSRDRCDETVMCCRTVRDERYRYIRNFTPNVPLMAPNAYKKKSYPVWGLIKKLHVQGKLTPEQETLCLPTMPDEELYDLEEDPYEMHNLADSEQPEHHKALVTLRHVLKKWITDTRDQGLLQPKCDTASLNGRKTAPHVEEGL